jgi:outer membrane protein insertion porin family
MRMGLRLSSWVLCGCLAAAPRPAPAAEFAAFDGLAVEKLEIRGLPGSLADPLQSGLALDARRSGLRKRKPAFDSETLAADVRRTNLFLSRNGYPWARVTPHVERSGRKSVQVRLEVEPGRGVQVDSVSVTGLPADVAPRLARDLGVRTGAPLVDATIDAAARSAESVLQDAGYAKCRIKPEVELTDSTRARVRFVVLPGPLWVFGRTVVDGVPADLVPVARRTIDIEPGKRYSPKALRDAQDNLRLLDLFRQVRLTATPADSETLAVRADLSPREPHQIEARVGYLSEEKLRTRLGWRGRNTFGGGRGLGMLGSYSLYKQEGRISTWWPALLTPRTRETFSLAYLREVEDAYTQWSGGVEATTLYRHSVRTSASLSVRFGYVDAQFTAEDEPDLVGWATVFTSQLSWDRTDDRLRPTRGTLTWAEADLSPDFLPSPAPYTGGEIGNSVYVPMGPSVVVAGHLVVGLASRLGTTERLLPNRRFYAGGANSNRGFERRALGPRDSDGNPVGGEAKVEVQSEVRCRLVWKLQGAVFYDIGQVWDRVSSMNLKALQPSAGFALMIDTPVGPVRTDFGWRLLDHGTDPAWVFNFLIGHPF